MLGQRHRARKALEACLVMAQEIADRRRECAAIWTLSDLADEDGDPARALDLAGGALALCREIGDDGGVTASLIQLGGLHLQAGHDDEGLERVLRLAVAVLLGVLLGPRSRAGQTDEGQQRNDQDRAEASAPALRILAHLGSTPPGMCAISRGSIRA